MTVTDYQIYIDMHKTAGPFALTPNRCVLCAVFRSMCGAMGWVSGRCI